MEQWKEYRLSELCDILSGGTPKTTESKYWGGGIPWLSVKDFGNVDKYVYTTEKTITNVGFEHCPSKMLQKDDIIISARGTVGAIAMISSSMSFNQSCFGLRGNDLVDKHFLYYLIHTKVRELRSNSHGSVFDTITRNTFDNIICNIPSKVIQHKIATILSFLDDKIELNRKINSNLEEQAKALFKSWFIDFEPFKDGKFVDSELGKIPEGWKMVQFETFISESQDKVKVGTYPAYSVTNNGITPRIEKFKKQLSKATSKEKILRKDDLVFGMSRQILNWGIMQDEIGGVSSAYHVYKIDKERVVPTYLRYFIKGYQTYFRDLIGTAAREGQSLDKGALMNKKLFVPSEDILQAFIQHITTLENAVRLFKRQCYRLSSLRDSLLPRLMSGEIEVRL